MPLLAPRPLRRIAPGAVGGRLLRHQALRRMPLVAVQSRGAGGVAVGYLATDSLETRRGWPVRSDAHRAPMASAASYSDTPLLNVKRLAGRVDLALDPCVGVGSSRKASEVRPARRIAYGSPARRPCGHGGGAGSSPRIPDRARSACSQIAGSRIVIGAASSMLEGQLPRVSGSVEEPRRRLRWRGGTAVRAV